MNKISLVGALAMVEGHFVAAEDHVHALFPPQERRDPHLERSHVRCQHDRPAPRPLRGLDRLRIAVRRDHEDAHAGEALAHEARFMDLRARVLEFLYDKQAHKNGSKANLKVA